MQTRVYIPFRAADFTILMNFQDDFGDGLADDDTRTMVKLEENYRSTSNILEVANHLIENKHRTHRQGAAGYPGRRGNHLLLPGR